MEYLREGLLIGCGNPLLDISANVEEEFLKKYNLKANDAILAETKHMPIYDELVKNYKAEYIAGGSVQNTLRVCQWLLQKPCVTVFFGSVGKDKYAEILEDKAREDGVDAQYQFQEDIPTGTCAVLITGSNRSLCANLAAANCFTVDHLKLPGNQKIIQNAKYFYISGFFLTVSPPSILELALYAFKHEREFIMNLSAPFILEYYKDPLMSVYPYVDILFGNEDEALNFAKHIGNWSTTDVKEIGVKLAQMPKANKKRSRIVIITQGLLPVLVIQGDSVKSYPVMKIDKVVDTNGAGDAFVGGFLAQYMQNKNLEVCIDCGMWAANQIIQRSGCTFEGVPSYTEKAV